LVAVDVEDKNALGEERENIGVVGLIRKRHLEVDIPEVEAGLLLTDVK
jgi:hypothetical protein